MNKSNNFRKNISFLGIVVVLSAVILPGCGSFVSDMGNNFNSDGLPKQKFFVGGGLQIDWIAPVDGTIYLVEENTRKILMTKSLEAGEDFELSVSDMNSDEAKKLLGVSDISKLNFSLYFIPTKETPSGESEKDDK